MTRMPRKHIGLFLLMGAILAVIAFITWPRSVSAQCGSSASSCKNCHEVKKQDPVNTKGEWHTAHAFGDFCEFCHAGNVKAKDQAAAHTGLISPLSDVKGSCQSCHPNDYMDRAKRFADTLGVQIGSGGGSTTARTSSAVATSDGTGSCGPGGSTGGQLIDLNKIYAAGMGDVPSSNFGNMVLLVLIGATVLTFGGLAAHYEHPIERGIAAWRNLVAAPVFAPAMEQAHPRPELGALMPLLSSSDSSTLRSVAQLLSDRENGPKILQALGHIDLSMLAALGENDAKALTALLALTKEMK